jgi:hypothetical protein
MPDPAGAGLKAHGVRFQKGGGRYKAEGVRTLVKIASLDF